jgi:hypothetical protein
MVRPVSPCERQRSSSSRDGSLLAPLCPSSSRNGTQADRSGLRPSRARMEDEMADRFSRIDAPRSAPEVGATPRQARWSWVIVAAIVVALGLAFYGISANQSGQKVASQPAVTAGPAPARRGCAARAANDDRAGRPFSRSRHHWSGRSRFSGAALRSRRSRESRAWAQAELRRLDELWGEPPAKPQGRSSIGSAAYLPPSCVVRL